MRVGQKIQAKIKNRWRDAKIVRVNKDTYRVEWVEGQITVKHKEVRKKPVKKVVKKTVTKQTKKPSTRSKSTTTTKPTVTAQKSTTTERKTPRPGTKANPWIPLADLRSQSAIANMDYETKVKFDSIIKNLIDVYGWKGN